MGFEKPEDSRDAVRILEKHKVISSSSSKNIQDFISFRNLLVHRYGKIDDDIEFTSMKEGCDDILVFISEIETFVKLNEDSQ